MYDSPDLQVGNRVFALDTAPNVRIPALCYVLPMP